MLDEGITSEKLQNKVGEVWNSKLISKFLKWYLDFNIIEMLYTKVL